MLNVGLIITLMGMGTVFSFLLILVFAMFITSKILIQIGKIFPEKIEQPVQVKTKSSQNDEEIAVALAATKALV